MNKSTLGALALIAIFLIALAGLSMATQERRPAPLPNRPNEPPLPECPHITLDDWCGGSGTATDHSFTEALASARVACQFDMANCPGDQAQELADNKATCEAVSGCTLKYTMNFKSCDGSWKNCDPKPGTVIEDENTMYKCKIEGTHDMENYNCSRGPAGPGEQTA